MMKVVFQKSTRRDKKFDAIFTYIDGSTKKVSFGQRGASDFTKHKDPIVKDRYLKRHQPNENWDKPDTAGALSRWILWNKPTLLSSIRDFKKRFRLK